MEKANNLKKKKAPNDNFFSMVEVSTGVIVSLRWRSFEDQSHGDSSLLSYCFQYYFGRVLLSSQTQGKWPWSNTIKRLLGTRLESGVLFNSTNSSLATNSHMAIKGRLWNAGCQAVVSSTFSTTQSWGVSHSQKASTSHLDNFYSDLQFTPQRPTLESGYHDRGNVYSYIWFIFVSPETSIVLTYHTVNTQKEAKKE